MRYFNLFDDPCLQCPGEYYLDKKNNCELCSDFCSVCDDDSSFNLIAYGVGYEEKKLFFKFIT